MTILIFLLGLLCCVLLALLLRQQNRMQQLLSGLREIPDNPSRKLFAAGNGAPAQACYEINRLVEKYEQALTEQKRLAQANKELLTSLSHDVRTPLASLLGYLEALENGVVQGEERRHYLTVARKKAYDLKELVDTLFDWFKIDAREMRLTLQPTDLCELTKEVLIDFLPALSQKGITPVAELPDEEYLVRLDGRAFRRVVSNLIANALEHSGCNCLTLRAALVEGSVSLTVRDNGRGIESGKLPYIFDRLYKGDRARSKRSSGLGLCIARELAEMQHGTLTVQSVPGDYTEFTLRFPAEGNQTMYIHAETARNSKPARD